MVHFAAWLNCPAGLYGYKLGTTVIDKLNEQMALISHVPILSGVTVIAGLAIY